MKAIYSEIQNSHPSLKRGKVWCRTCGKKQYVNSANCLLNGWPKCCGYTMTIDHVKLNLPNNKLKLCVS